MEMERAVLVTGSAGGVGEAIVRHLAKRGWNVAAICQTMLRLQPFLPETLTRNLIARAF